MADPYRGKFGTYLDAFKIYEDGKHRRYSLLFAVNTAVAGLAAIVHFGSWGTFGRGAVTVGMIIFTILMGFDIWVFGQRMRRDVGDDAGDTNQGIFSFTGKLVLWVCCGLLVFGWACVGLTS